MKLIILCLGVLALVYEGDCALTAWTEPVITAAVDGTGTYTYAETKAAGLLETLQATTATAYVLVSQPTPGKLTLHASTGALTLEANQNFDYETNPTYVIVVTGSDGTLTGTVTITISITDVASDANYGTSYTSFYRVDDATAASITVATITATGGTAAYAISATGNTGTDFAYASGTGVLTTVNALARSRTSAYSLILEAVAASVTSTANIVVCVGTIAQCGTCTSDSGVAGLQISLALLLVAIMTLRIK